MLSYLQFGTDVEDNGFIILQSCCNRKFYVQNVHEIYPLYPHSTELRSVPDLARSENRDQSGINVNWTAVIVNWAAMSGNGAAWSGRSGAIFEHVQRLLPI